ncbi:helix-turn-helix domain-containing protein [Deinococcus sp. KSM4-11]|uniref:helix-turn-helix domain-containing protein n=1 Tax=Deinococcus sp. KSM4-11 TaxID=2568654 RepID=UPI001454D357|nr:helix-turn-helix domain-containing protein [Deinococcus sp. KSM4-11]
MQLDELTQAINTTLPALLDRVTALQQGSGQADTILNTAEAAKLLRIGQPVLIELVKQGMIPGWYVGNGWRFSRAQVLAAFHAQAQRAADAARGGADD